MFIFLLSIFVGKLFAVDLLFEETIKDAHDAMWESFVPFLPTEQDLVLKDFLKKAKKQAYFKILDNDQLKAALILLGNINTFQDEILLHAYYLFVEKDENSRKSINNKNLSNVKNFLKDLNYNKLFLHIKDLSKEERISLINILINSRINFLRKIGFYIRMFYVNEIYQKDLLEYIASVKTSDDNFNCMPFNFPKLYTDLSYDEENKNLDGEIDALIVGSGASSSVIAYNLQKAGFKVLVVEKGSFVVPGSVKTKDNFNFLDKNGLRMSENGSIILLNANVAGGGPTVNIDLSFSPLLDVIKHRFNLWHENSLIPSNKWTFEDIYRSNLWTESFFAPRTVLSSEVNENNDILKRGADALGLNPKYFKLNTNEKNHKKSSLEKLLIPSMLDKKNSLTFLSNCEVNKVLIKNGKALGVKCTYHKPNKSFGVLDDIYGFNIKDNETIKIKAKAIILAAGNLGTSSILLSSKINNPNIGKGFVTHPFVPIAGVFKEPVRAYEGVPSSIFVDDFLPTDENPKAQGFVIESASGQNNLAALIMPGSPRQVLLSVKNADYIGGLGVILIDNVNPNNKIEKENNNLKVYYELLEKDKKRFIKGIKVGINILFKAGATDVFFNTFEEPLFLYDNIACNTIKPYMDLDEVFADFEFLPNKTLLMGAHMMGGNKMGMSAQDSVVNPKHEVWGVENLYVADASVFPTSVGANPMQTIYAMAKIFSDEFIAKYGD